MSQYQIKQKFWSLGGKFKIKDNAGNLAYHVQGSFMKIPKQFTITKPDGTLVSHIKKVMFQILPKFDVTLADGSRFQIRKSLRFLNPVIELNILVWKFKEISGIWILNCNITVCQWHTFRKSGLKLIQLIILMSMMISMRMLLFP